MFAKKNRFSFKRGVPRKIFSTPFFVVRYDKNEDGVFRCSVVVGKKVDKKAVARNRIKRIIVSQVKEIVPESTGLEVVIYAKKPIAELEKEELTGYLSKTFETIK